MEDNTELLEKYIEEGKLPLKGELFSRKAKIAEKLRLHREESRRITVSRQRKRGGERSAALYWGPKPETFQCSEPNSWWYNKERKCL